MPQPRAAPRTSARTGLRPRGPAFSRQAGRPTDAHYSRCVHEIVLPSDKILPQNPCYSPRSACAPHRARKARTMMPTPWCAGPRHRGEIWPWEIIRTRRPTSCMASRCYHPGRCVWRASTSAACEPTPRLTESFSKPCAPPWPRSTTILATKRASTSPHSRGRGGCMKWVNECAPMLVPLRACRDKPSPASGVNVPLARRLKMTSPALALRQDPSALHMQRDSSCAGSWGYQWCTEMTQPFTQGTDRDFFFCPNGTFYVKRNCSQWVCASLAEPCLNACPHPACAHAERRQTRMCTVLERQPEVRVRCSTMCILPASIPHRALCQARVGACWPGRQTHCWRH